MSLAPGTRLGVYEVISQLGAGGRPSLALPSLASFGPVAPKPQEGPRP